MSSINLLDLPDHLLAKILSHIPDHFEVSSVCQKFYEIDCYNSLKYSNIKLWWSICESKKEGFTESVLASKRTIRRMELFLNFNEPEQIELTKQIVERHGHSVKKLALLNDFITPTKKQITEATLVQLLNCFPNLEELYLSLPAIIIEKGDSEVLKLTKLETLRIYLTSTLFFENRFPKNLRKIEIKSKNYEGKISPGFLEKLKSMKLEELTFDGFWEFPIGLPELKSLLKTQQNSLKSLSIYFDRDSDDFKPEILSELKNMKKLESLNVTDVTSFSAEVFSKLTQLKSLGVGYCENLEEISLVKTVPVEELFIGASPSSNVLQQFGQNYPIKSLKLRTVNETLEFFMQNFPRLESLDLEYCQKVAFMNENHRVVYPNLKRLTVGYKLGYKKKHFEFEFLRSFPNLEELEITLKIKDVRNFPSDLRTILGRLRKLEIEFPVVDGVDVNSSEESIEVLQKLSKVLESADLFLKIGKPNEIARYLDKLRGYYRIEQKIGGLRLKKF